jgi:hypothetical protein
MSPDPVGRRRLLGQVGALALPLSLGDAAGAAAPPGASALASRTDRARTPLEPGAHAMPSWDRDPVRTYVRVVADLAGADTWKWFSGRLHAALPDGAIVPLLGFDSLIRRRAGPFDAAGTTIRFSEATVFHDPATGEILDEYRNPLNGRVVRPLHYPEGPNLLPTTPSMFARGEDGGGFGPWTVSDGTARFTRESRTDAPHPLDPAVWKLESSGPRFRALTLRSYAVDLAQLQDPARNAVAADYSLTVLSGWFPWMLLGQAPGQLLWQAQGRKVLHPDQVPSPLRARIAARFPGLFEPEVPWKGPMSFLRWHMEQRQPER